jgi:hypothetical protein
MLPLLGGALTAVLKGAVETGLVFRCEFHVYLQ